MTNAAPQTHSDNGICAGIDKHADFGCSSMLPYSNVLVDSIVPAQARASWKSRDILPTFEIRRLLVAKCDFQGECGVQEPDPLMGRRHTAEPGMEDLTLQS